MLGTFSAWKPEGSTPCNDGHGAGQGRTVPSKMQKAEMAERMVEASPPGHGGKQKSGYRYGYRLSQAFAVTLGTTTQ